MEWTKPVGLLVTLLVAALAVGGAVEIGRTTLATGDSVVAAGGVLGFLIVVVLGAIALGARSDRWINNPESYW